MNRTTPAILVALLCAIAGSPARAAGPTLSDLRARVAEARPGATLRIPAGTYPGPVIIDKPLSLLADPGAILEGRGDGDVLVVSAPDVTVRGFTIRRTGIDLDRENAAVTVSAPRARIEDNRIEDALFGISLRDAHGAVLRGNTIVGKLDLDVARRGDAIKLWNCNDAVIQDNHIRDARDLVMWYSKNLVVRGNRVERCRYGVHFMYAGNATVDDNVLRHNSVGIFLMYGQNLTLRRNVLAHNRGPSGYGLGLKDVDGVEAQDNVMSDNRVGLHVDNSPTRFDLTHTFRRNVFAHNDVALGLLPNVRANRFAENTFHDNIEQVGVFGGGDLKDNEFTVDGRGNYWSDYRGYDADRDGLGDVAYKSQSVFENLVDRDPRMRLFLFSPAQQAVDLASRAFPIVKPRLRATDSAPLMDPARPALKAAAAPAAAGGAPALAAAAGLLACGALVVAAGRRELDT
jgi:nitrous oxidase accessory protein